MRRRYSILSLMGLILVLAVGIAALRDANDHWAGGLLLATPTALGIALIGGLCGAERKRARRLGFAVLGGSYFALAFLGLNENLSKLPTTRLLTYIHQQVAPPQTFTVTFTGALPTSINPGTIIMQNIQPGPVPNTTTTTVTSRAWLATPANTPAATNRWQAMLPGAANYEAFSAVGHCLFALLAGLLGSVIALRFQKARERNEGASPPPLA